MKRLYSDYYFLADSLRPVTKANEGEKSAQQFHERVLEQIANFNECIDAYLSEMAARSPTEFSYFEKSQQDTGNDAYSFLHNGLRFRAAQM